MLFWNDKLLLVGNKPFHYNCPYFIKLNHFITVVPTSLMGGHTQYISLPFSDLWGSEGSTGRLQIIHL